MMNGAEFPACGTLSSSASEKVSVIVVPFAVAETNRGRVESAGVLLVTASPEKSGTGSFAMSTSRSGFASGAA